jgi:YaiO family outer membrane protein
MHPWKQPFSFSALAPIALTACLGWAWLAVPACAQPVTQGPVARAQDLATASRYAEARVLVESWLAVHPEDQDARYLLARISYWQGRPAEAWAHYQMLLAGSPENADYMQGAARALHALGQDGQALELADKARLAALNDPDAWRLELDLLEPGKGAQTSLGLTLRQQAAGQFQDPSWLVLPPVAADPAKLPWQLESYVGADGLTKGLPLWSEEGVVLTRALGVHRAIVGTARNVSRYGLSDREVGAGYYHPLNERLSVDVEGTLSPEHQILPLVTLASGAYWSAFEDWGLAADVRFASYTGAMTLRELLVLDRRLGPFRVAYTFSVTELSMAPLALDHALMGEWNYHNADREQLVVHGGQEMEFVGPGSLLVSNVFGFDVSGRNWLSERWGITHGADFVMQGTSYMRAGARLGGVYKF